MTDQLTLLLNEQGTEKINTHWDSLYLVVQYQGHNWLVSAPPNYAVNREVMELYLSRWHGYEGEFLSISDEDVIEVYE